MASRMQTKLTAALLLLLAVVAVAAPQKVTSSAALDKLSLEELEEQLQVSDRSSPRKRDGT